MPHRRARTLAALALVGAVAACSPSAPAETPDVEKQDATAAPQVSVTAEPQEAQEEAAPFTVDEAGYALSSGLDSESYAHWAAVLTNPNDTFYGAFPTVTVTARDAAGTVMATEQQVLAALPPATSIAWAGQLSVQGVPASIEVTYADVEWHPTQTTAADYPPFTATGVQMTGDDFSRDVVGELTNPYAAVVDEMAVTALYRDAAGTLIGGTTGFVSGLPANGSVPFSLMEYGGAATPASIEIWAVPWSGGPEVWNQLAAGE